MLDTIGFLAALMYNRTQCVMLADWTAVPSPCTVQIHKGTVTIPGYQERPANSSLARYHHPSLTDMQYRTPTVLYRSTTHCTGHKLPVIT